MFLGLPMEMCADWAKSSAFYARQNSLSDEANTPPCPSHPHTLTWPPFLMIRPWLRPLAAFTTIRLFPWQKGIHKLAYRINSAKKLQAGGLWTRSVASDIWIGHIPRHWPTAMLRATCALRIRVNLVMLISATSAVSPHIQSNPNRHCSHDIALILLRKIKNALYCKKISQAGK